MINKNSYYTPRTVAEKMAAWLKEGRKGLGIILEPSAGSGNLISVVKSRFDRNHVMACEIEMDAHPILRAKGAEVVGADFLETPIDIPPDTIIANPPFDKGVDHALKMWRVLADGGRMACQLNAETINNPYSDKRKKLLDLIGQYGRIEQLGTPYKGTGRSTNVEVVCVVLDKPITKKSMFTDFVFEKDYTDYETSDFTNTLEKKGANLIDLIKGYVHRYKVAVKLIQTKHQVAKELDMVTAPFSYNGWSDTKSLTLVQEIQKLKKQTWNTILNLSGFLDRMTEKVKSDFKSKFVIHQELPVTEKNIYLLIDILESAKGDIFESSVMEVFEWFTRDARCKRGGKWKTDDPYRVRNKVIVTSRYGFSSTIHWDIVEQLRNVDRVFQMITGNQQELTKTKSKEISNNGIPKTKLKSNYRLGDIGNRLSQHRSIKFVMPSYSIKFFSQSIHIWFHEERFVNTLNQIASKKYGWPLPETEQSYNKRK